MAGKKGSMKQKERFWVSASRVMEITGLDKYEMAGLREKNPGWWDKKNGKIMYDLNMIPETLIKKETV